MTPTTNRRIVRRPLCSPSVSSPPTAYATTLVVVPYRTVVSVPDVDLQFGNTLNVKIMILNVKIMPSTGDDCN